jgi:hypothetical protein
MISRIQSAMFLAENYLIALTSNRKYSYKGWKCDDRCGAQSGVSHGPRGTVGADSISGMRRLRTFLFRG